MSTTTAKRGTTARFLALTASLTMIVTGLVGVAAVGPATAAGSEESGDKDHKIWICHADMDKGNGTPGLGNGEWQLGWNVIPIAKAAWDAGQKDGHDQHPLDRIITPSFDSDGKEIRPTGADCGAPAVEYEYSKQITITKTICKAPRTITDASATGVLVTKTQYTAFTDGEKDAINTEALASATSAFTSAHGEYVDGACPGDFTYFKQETFTKTICTADGTITDASATGALISETRNEEFSQTQKDAVDTEALTSATSAFNAKYGAHSDGSCTPPVVVTPPVVEAAVVVAPAPAPVVAPAPLPATVEAPAPAPAPAAVTVPAAATVPAAVPAGDGSQAPGLPMWALALMVIGALGAAIAGKQIIGARN